MKAIILIGGLGTRLTSVSEGMPKSLVKVRGKEILARIIDSLTKYGVNDAIFLTGHLGNKIEDFVKKNYPQLNAVFISDPPDKDPNARYIYAMHMARNNLIGDDVLYLHGDLFFDPILAQKILSFPHSAALVKKNFISQKDFNAKITDGLITKIGVKVFDEGSGFCLPFYKFLRDDFIIWMDQIANFIKDKRWDCYAEDALNEVLDKIKLRPLYFENEYGMEIDDPEDLKIAEGIVQK